MLLSKGDHVAVLQQLVVATTHGKKPYGMWRPWSDFRIFHLLIKENRYKSPNIKDLTVQLVECTVLLKLYLSKGYHQVPVGSEHMHKTAIITPFGLYGFLRLLNAASQQVESSLWGPN
jgi:hypothetical protein